MRELLLESADEGILEVDLRGVCTFANRAAAQLLGATRADELVGKELHNLVHGHVAGSALPAELECRICRTYQQERGAGAERELFWRSDGSALPVECRSHPLRRNGRIEGFAVTFQDATEMCRLEQEVVQSSVRERQRIHRSLHDGLGQQLTTIVCLIESLSRKLRERGAPEVQDATQLHIAVNEMVAETRRLVRSLHPIDAGHSSLVLALTELLSGIQRTSVAACHFQCDEPIQIHDATLAEHAFGVAHEAIRNAVQHAQAKNIWVELRPTGRRVTLTVRDDGVGLPESSQHPRGLGFPMMTYHARAIEAELNVARDRAGGTIVRCAFPTGKPERKYRPLGSWRPAPTSGLRDTTQPNAPTEPERPH
jgi:PAS domain S-box-containing protein